MFYLGKTKDTREVSLSKEDLLRHVVSIGSSGSGKTVSCKLLIEDAALNGIPSIIIDPQGDIGSFLSGFSPDDAEKLGFDPETALLFQEKAHINIYTPGSSVGRTFSLNPLGFELGENISKENAIQILDASAKSITSILKYTGGAEERVSKFIYLCLEYIYENSLEVGNFSDFENFLAQVPDEIASLGLLTDLERVHLKTQVKMRTIGFEKLLFESPSFSINDLLWAPSGKTAISIIYLNTLNTQREKDLCVNHISQKIYSWMLENPSSSLQMLFYIDEIAPFLPAGALKPISKESLLLLFRQARKFGVGCITATQSFGDMDYKALSQFNTWNIGKLATEQELKKVKKVVESRCSRDETKELLQTFPKLKGGEFILIHPKEIKPIRYRTRRLHSNHFVLGIDLIPQFKTYLYHVKTFNGSFLVYSKLKTVKNIKDRVRSQSKIKILGIKPLTA